MTVTESVALKEWASVVSAVAAGDQVVLVRKGGLADRNFGVQASSFLLMPTYLHQAENQFRSEFAHHVQAASGSDDAAAVTLAVHCEVVQTHEVRDLERMLALRDDVIFTDDTLRERYAFRPDQALFVIGVRARTLSPPATVENLRRYGGCKSWITLAEPVTFEVSPAAVDDHELRRRLDAIASKLS